MSPRWRRVAGLAWQVLWVVLKLTLVVALLNRNAADFVYAGF